MSLTWTHSQIVIPKKLYEAQCWYVHLNWSSKWLFFQEAVSLASVKSESSAEDSSEEEVAAKVKPKAKPEKKKSASKKKAKDDDDKYDDDVDNEDAKSSKSKESAKTLTAYEKSRIIPVDATLPRYQHHSIRVWTQTLLGISYVRANYIIYFHSYF